MAQVLSSFHLKSYSSVNRLLVSNIDPYLNIIADDDESELECELGMFS